jgi:uncharacterized membrane protein YcaP (DUF421 family)
MTDMRCFFAKGPAMLNDLADILNRLFGDLSIDLTAGNMALRAVATFAVTVAVLRLGSKRLFGKGTAFDTVVAIMIGSVMSSAITSSGSMVAIWAGGAALVAMHWALGWLSFHIDTFGTMIKGQEIQLVRDGEMLEDGMDRTSTTPRDLERAMRQDGKVPDVSMLQLAYMERDGSISVVPKSSEPKVVEVAVRDGVQTVRIAIK